MNLFALIRKRKWASVIQDLGIFPDEANVPTKQTFNCGTAISCLPIHLACMRQPPLQVIAALIAASPSSLEVKDGIGRLPLHNAIRYRAPTKIIACLISAAPRATYVQADDGSLPLHLACLYGDRIDFAIIRYLTLVNPEATIVADGHGLLPIDVTSDNPNGDEVQNAIIEILESADKHLEMFENDDSSSTHRSMNAGAITDSASTATSLLPTLITVPPTGTAREAVESAEASGSDNLKYCVVCMEREVRRVFVPCGHVCLCDRCATDKDMDKMRWRCPECRSDVREVVKFFGRVLM